MLFDPGVLSQPYPLRDPSVLPGSRHSVRYSDNDVRRLLKLFKRFRREFAGMPDAWSEPFPQVRMKADGRLDLRAVAREMAAMAAALEHTAELTIGPHHAASAWSLLYRQIDVIPGRSDRVVVCGLAAAALARTGLHVHLIVDGENGRSYPQELLQPAFDHLAISFASISIADEAPQRTHAYQQSVVLLSARECAMDFLRDAVASPGRANPDWLRSNRIGRREGKQPVMRGLPCAILLDVDSSLIDNARAPIVLHGDGGKIVSDEDIAKALKMVESLEKDVHYLLTGEGAEAQLTEQGLEQFNQWCGSLGGLWSANHIAQTVLGAAIVSSQLIHPKRHYRIDQQKVRWLVQERLIPGATIYPAQLLRQFVETIEGIENSAAQAVAARSSYQQLFNHYLHLCGTAFDVAGHRRELRKRYGLRTRRVWALPLAARFQRAAIVADQANQDQWVTVWAQRHAANTCSLVVVGDADSAARLADVIRETAPGVVDASALDGDALLKTFEAGGFPVVTVAQLDQHQPMLSGRTLPLIRSLTLYRSPRLAEDRRQVSWRRLSSVERNLTSDWLLMAADDKLFEGYAIKRLQLQLRASGQRLGARILERAIQRIQHRLAIENAATRKMLSEHDAAMQGILAFSGRGLFAD